MAIVTLLTDSGESDHYVAAIKARIISVNPGVRIEDISHKIKPADIGHAAFVLRAVFRDSSYASDSTKINVDQIFKLLSPSTEVKSL